VNVVVSVVEWGLATPTKYPSAALAATRITTIEATNSLLTLPYTEHVWIYA